MKVPHFSTPLKIRFVATVRWLSSVATALLLSLPASLPRIHAANAPTSKASPIPLDQVGAVAGQQSSGDGLAVLATQEGARLRCVFQKMEGEVTREGLWLTSTVAGNQGGRFRVMAAAVARATDVSQPSRLRVSGASTPRAASGDETSPELAVEDACATSEVALPRDGAVEVADKLARFVRPGLTEEYSVSMDGLRQDFIIGQRPVGAGPLRVVLNVVGAKVEPLSVGTQLVLEDSGRKILYSRLRVTDATGKELTARMEMMGGTGHWPVPSADSPDGMAATPECKPSTFLPASVTPVPLGESPSGTGGSPVPPSRKDRGLMLAVVVNDAEAVYPVRIDPTFSDANWISMNPSIPGVNGGVYAAVVDGSGNLYIGGDFTSAGGILANRIAKWNGSSWTALGSGMNDYVRALAVSGSDLYAGGEFTAAGGSAANYIAKWNGSSWTALGSGMNDDVSALAVSGSDLYAGGVFTSASGTAANYIAKWNGRSWTALGSGLSFWVEALAVSGSDLYAGGLFTAAGGTAANYIAKWNGSSWTALGSGMNGRVFALAVSGSDLYAGGLFTSAGGRAANRIAKWNGSSWTALGSGLGLSYWVTALEVSGSDLYAGGYFTTAGGKVSAYIARAYLLPLPALSVLRSGTDVKVSWPSADTTGFVLEQASTLAAPASWVTNTASVTDDGSHKSVTLPATNSPQFFRLRRP